MEPALVVHDLSEGHVVVELHEALTSPGPTLELHVVQDAETGRIVAWWEDEAGARLVIGDDRPIAHRYRVGGDDVPARSVRRRRAGLCRVEYAYDRRLAASFARGVPYPLADGWGPVPALAIR